MTALSAFAAETDQDKSGDLEHDTESVISDLLCDLIHYMSDTNTDPVSEFTRLVGSAIGNYEEEVDEEEVLTTNDLEHARRVLMEWEQYARTLTVAGIIALPTGLVNKTVALLDATAV